MVQAGQRRQRPVTNRVLSATIRDIRSKRICYYDRTKDAFVFRSPYSQAFYDMVSAMPGRRFVDGAWQIGASPLATDGIRALISGFGFEADNAVSRRLLELDESNRALRDIDIPDAGLRIPGFTGRLRDFQMAGVLYHSAAERSINADVMGLGKTITTIATVLYVTALPCIIVSPAAQKLHWKREIERFAPGLSVSVLEGSGGLSLADFVIVNYDILGKRIDALLRLRARCIVFDESHKLKNYKAQRTQHARRLAAGIRYRFALTGTPIEKYPAEFCPQLDILGQIVPLAGGKWNFLRYYCGAKQGRFGLDVSGAEHLDELLEKLRSLCYMRHTKEQVLAELPPLTRTVIPVELSNRKEYDRAETDIISYIRERAAADIRFSESLIGLSESESRKLQTEYVNSKEWKARSAQTIVKINALKQIAARGKLGAIIEWIEDFLESGQKLIVFAHSVDLQDALYLHFPDAARLFAVDRYKTTPERGRKQQQANADRFQVEPSCKLIICSLKAAGVGFTLTAASDVLFCELGWNPSEHDQAEARAYARINDPHGITAWYIVGDRTIDERIMELIEKKRKVVNQATDGIESEDESIYNGLLEYLQGRAKV